MARLSLGAHLVPPLSPFNVRLVSTQPCSPSRVADFYVLRPARHTRVCLRGRVLHKSSHPRRFRSAAASKQAALGNSGRIRAGRAGYRARPGFLTRSLFPVSLSSCFPSQSKCRDYPYASMSFLSQLFSEWAYRTNSAVPAFDDSHR